MEAVRQSVQADRETAGYYLSLLQPIQQVLEALLSCQESLSQAAAREPQTLARTIRDAYEKTLVVKK